MDIQGARGLVANMAAKYNWGLLSEKNDGRSEIFVLQVGQWGLSFKGAQNLTIVLQSEQNGVRGAIVSKSIMGQMLDWGANQKNLDTAVSFFEWAINNKENVSTTLSPISEFTKPKPKISRGFWVVFLLIPIIGALYFVYYVQVLLPQEHNPFISEPTNSNTQFLQLQNQYTDNFLNQYSPYSPATTSGTIH